MANNNPVELLEKQLNYMWYTMTTKNSKKREWFEGMGKDTYNSPLKISAKKFITSNKSVKMLAKTFCSCYLRPAKCKSRGKERARWAKKWYKEGVIVNE